MNEKIKRGSDGIFKKYCSLKYLQKKNIYITRTYEVHNIIVYIYYKLVNISESHVLGVCVEHFDRYTDTLSKRFVRVRDGIL